MIQDETERRLAATTRERDQAFAKLRVLESKIQDTEIEKGGNTAEVVVVVKSGTCFPCFVDISAYGEFPMKLP